MTHSSFAFLFMDECFYAPLDLAALTGVLVPSDKYAAVRDSMCRLVSDVLAPAKDHISAPIELHASDLLRKQKDEAKVRVFSAVVHIVNENRLPIVRTTYMNQSQIANVFQGDPKLYGINFFNIQAWLEKTMDDTLVIPVMDGVPSVRTSAKKAPRIDPQLIRAFARNVRMTHQIRQHKAGAEMLSIKNLENLGEPLFADSAHSTLLQLVDLVSYMLLQVERADLETASTPDGFRQLVLAQARTLEYSYWRGRMQHRDS